MVDKLIRLETELASKATSNSDTSSIAKRFRSTGSDSNLGVRVCVDDGADLVVDIGTTSADEDRGERGGGSAEGGDSRE